MSDSDENKELLVSIVQQTIDNFSDLKKRIENGEAVELDRIMVQLGKAALALKKIKGD